jgi:exonuclease SbcC
VLNDRAILLAACEKAHGRNGVPALILENRVPAIEAAATDLLAALGGNTAGARVELRTQREKKSGGTEDRLDVILVTADGYDRAYDSWSTGERCRIDVALAKAILPGVRVPDDRRPARPRR